MTTTETGTDVPMRQPGQVGETVTWADVQWAARELAGRWLHSPVDSVYGVPTGGAPVAVMVANLMRVPLVELPLPDTLVVDDLVDTGRTLRAYLPNRVDALFRKPWSPADLAPGAILRDSWLRFPWERDGGAPTDAVLRLLQFLGEDPTRDGLLDTPKRVVRALAEMTSGYQSDPAAVLGTTFDVAEYGDEMVLVRRIPFASLCEHHMLPFTGHATVAYVPGARVVGLSKIPRLVVAFARRLQVQERLTVQIADALNTHLDARGVGVLIEADHTCMSNRGVERRAPMVTSAVRGVLANGRRGEFFALATSGT